MGVVYDLLKDLPVSAALAERIKLIEAETVRIRDENVSLKKEKTDLFEKVTQLEQELSELKASEDEFVNHCGVKFKKVPSGEHDKMIPYCPSCRKAMFANRKLSRVTHECSLCGFRAPFTVREIKFVTKDLNS